MILIYLNLFPPIKINKKIFTLLFFPLLFCPTGMAEKVEQFYIHKTEQKVQRFPTCLIATRVHSLLYYQHHAHHDHAHHPPEWYIVTNDKPALPHHYHPKSTVYVSFHQGTVYSLGFDKYIMMYIHHYDITQNSFTVLKFLCVPIIHYPLRLNS